MEKECVVRETEGEERAAARVEKRCGSEYTAERAYSVLLCASGDTGRSGERPKWRERAVASVAGREALRDCVREQREGVVCHWRKSVWCERLEVRNAPRHVP